MWGAMGGAVSGGITSLLSSAAKSGSQAAASAAVQKGLDIVTDTALDIAQNASQGQKITLASVAGSLAFNIITAGNGNGSAKSAGNAIADSAEDGVRREVKDSLGDSVSRGGSKPVQTISNKFPKDNQAGKRLNYTIDNGRVHMENGVRNVDFVIDMDGNLHVGRGHSYLASGSSVQTAGTMKVNSQGYVRLITNISGHFQPTVAQTMNYPMIIRNAGIDIDNSWIRIAEFNTSMSNYVIDSKVFYHGPIKNMP